ncbi:MAG TPA: cytochrome c [Myxococcota bacterium]|nr:cytochrome c [Myxococcota bacterium]
MRSLFVASLAVAFVAVATLGRAADDWEAKYKAADAAKGAQVFQQYCVTCHGTSGLGDGPVGKTLNPPPRNFQEGKFKYGDSPKDHFDVVTNGAASKGGSPMMAPWGAVIPEADRWSVIKYVVSLKKK